MIKLSKAETKAAVPVAALAGRSRRERHRSRGRNRGTVLRWALVAVGLLLLAAADLEDMDRRLWPVITLGVGEVALGSLVWLTLPPLRRLVGSWAQIRGQALERIGFLWPRRLPRRAAREVIIVHPEMKTPLLLRLEMLVSLTAWGVLLYLLQSLFTTGAWLAGGYLMFFQVFNAQATEGTVTMLVYSVYWAGVIFAAFYVWANWNLFRFGGLDRRKARPAPSNTKIASDMKVSLGMLQQAQMAKVAKVTLRSGRPEFIVEQTLNATTTVSTA